jgi:hypothetical protein
LLVPKLEQALAHAKRLAKNQGADGEHSNPSTRVHELVTRLQAVAASRHA